MKFKKGDIVICVSNSGDWMTDAHLKIGGRYTIKNVYDTNRDINIYLEETKFDYPYNKNRFITIEEYRALKINKIKNGIQSGK